MPTKVILAALVQSLGGDAQKLEAELDELFQRYPNVGILAGDIMKNFAVLSQEVIELNGKVEVLKDCLVQNKLLLQVKAPDNIDVSDHEAVQKFINTFLESKEQSTGDEEIKINDIVWHHLTDDEVPN